MDKDRYTGMPGTARLSLMSEGHQPAPTIGPPTRSYAPTAPSSACCDSTYKAVSAQGDIARSTWLRDGWVAA